TNSTVQALLSLGQTISDTFTYTAQDGSGSSSTTQVTVTIHGANDSPTVSQVTGAVTAYDFENGSGNSPSTVTGGPTMSIAAPVTYSTSAGRFPGSTGLLFNTVGTSSTRSVTLGTIPGVATSNAFTFGAWVRYDAVDSWSRVFDFGGANSWDVVALTRNGTGNTLQLVAYSGANFQASVNANGALTGQLGQWMHVTGTIASNGLMTLYINGASVGSTTLAALPNFSNWTSNLIGASNWTADALFRGAIDEIAIFDRALSAAEVATLASTGSMPTVVNKSIAENSANGTVVFKAKSLEVDSGDTTTYSIVSGNTNSAFAINSSTGQLTVANSTSLNFEATPSFSLVIRAADSQGVTADQTVTVTLTDVNDAPTITSGHTYTLPGTNEDTTSSGTLASTILTGASWADVDAGAVSGLAITAVTGNGTWQYSTDGTTWANFGAVNSTNALLITSTSQVRYIPNAQNGETATFTYKAWDRTTGTASTNATPSYATTASSGGSTAFSTNNASAQITVTSVNDAPTITNGHTATLVGTNEDTTSSATLVSAILTLANQADVDSAALSGMAITATTGSGTWQYSTNGTTWANFGSVSGTNALLITSTSQVRYIPNGQNGETATFTYKAWDQTSGTASTNATPSYASTASSGGATAFSTNNATAQITLTSVNDAPTITSGYT
ncbi:MAG: LamG-like jellyroll fold domain-containing protein, partial [Planctomycetota bacterium]